MKDSLWIKLLVALLLGLALGALLGPRQARAEGLRLPADWSTRDTVRQGVVTAEFLLDRAQTLYIARHPNTWSEKNGRAVINAHPSVGAVNTYFAAGIVLHAIVSAVLPPDWRAGWQYVWIGSEAETVGHNYRIGIRFSFK